jgi:hypothetical protein
MTSHEAHIQWAYQGKPDFLMGTGATRAERVLVWTGALIGAGLYLYFFLTGAYVWAWWQYALAALMALDVGGGVVANTLNSCKRFYHTPPLPTEPWYAPLLKNHLVFTAMHGYPFVIAWVFDGGLVYGVFWYVTMLAAALIVLRTPLYLQRPTAFLIILMALLVHLYGVTPPPGFEWFMPALLLKIIYGHLVREEPYRPAGRSEVARPVPGQ